MIIQASVRIKRVHDAPTDNDALRVLVDRLWPRGLSKANARIDLWLKDVAPSHDLRKRFHGHPAQWMQFVASYEAELAQGLAGEALDHLRGLIKKGRVTLLFAARDPDHNNAAALRDLLARR
jgi:uncharacterized protein YeaO (DUF488 family)